MAVLLGACASQVPQNIRQAPPDNPSLGEVRAQAPDYLGREVRWGGTIIETGNRANTTRFIVLGRPLNKGGQPGFTDDSAGRFIAIVPEFLDPEVYAPDRQVTFTRTLIGTEAGKVGEYPYTYPFVQAQAWYLWPKQLERPYRYEDPWYYDTWYYDPWFYRPWYHDPWYLHGFPHHHNRH
jgi:outer membrane lipoprotein